MGWHLLARHPLFGSLCGLVQLTTVTPDHPFAKDGFARLVLRGKPSWQQSRLAGAPFDYAYVLHANGWQRAQPAEWANVLG